MLMIVSDPRELSIGFCDWEMGDGYSVRDGTGGGGGAEEAVTLSLFRLEGQHYAPPPHFWPPKFLIILANQQGV